MPTNAKKIRIGGVSHDIEDTQARSDISALKSSFLNQKAGILRDTTSGAIASFVLDSTIDNLLGVTVDIEPVQAGSGDPSPDNVRPISGRDAVEISVSSGSDTRSYTISLGQTVYGGTLDVTSGVLTVDRAKVSLSTASGIYRNSAKQYYAALAATPGIKAPGAIEASVLSNQFKPSTSTSADGIVFLNAGGNIRFNTTAEYASAAEMVAALGTIEFCYPLATPTTIQLDPVTIAAIAGQTNNVWADVGGVTVEYAADIKTYIDQKIAATVAALS